MNLIDFLLSSLIPVLVLLHLLIAPYSKIEESFNIEATHDILSYGLPTQNINASLAATYDHVSFPGPVPRTFIGPLFLAGISKPIINIVGFQRAQFVVRAVLGFFNTFALLKFKNGLATAFGRDVGRWYILLQASQFHVIFYASRTLPNMFVFGLTTLALSEFLPAAIPVETRRKQQRGIFLLVAAGVIFRSEVAVLLFAQLTYMLIQPRISLQTIIPAGLISAGTALAFSVPIDSYFYQKLVWPELVAFYFNAIQGNASGWGTSPWHAYFTSMLPRIMLNPLILCFLIPLSFIFPATKSPSLAFFIPSHLFIALYSFLPHKEPRFIIYVVPALTAAASLSASYIWTRRSKSLLYQLGSLLLLASIACSFIASTTMLLISSLNYPGGEALHQLHKIIAQDALTSFTNTTSPQQHNINIYTDILSCMTGVTLFLEHAYPLILPNNQTVHFSYDKTEREDWLGLEGFWDRFDYALMEEPAFAIGRWDVVGTVWAYKGIQVLRPGERAVGSVEEIIGRVYQGNMVTGEDGEVLGREGFRRAVEEGVGLGDKGEERVGWKELARRWGEGEKSRFDIWRTVRVGVRLLTGGWWVGPKMEPEIWLLRRGDGRPFGMGGNVEGTEPLI